MSDENVLDTRIDRACSRLHAYFTSGATQKVTARIDALDRLRNTIRKYEQQLYEALRVDLHKAPQEAYMTEISIVLQEITLHRCNLKKWNRPRRAKTPLFMFGSSCRIIPQPLGVVLIIAPWNYPVQLLINPLIGAISAGNCAMLKPSPYAPSVNRVIEKIIAEVFAPGYVEMIEGGREVNTALLARRWDYIFFTGSPALGKVVMRAAAEHMTPLTLELGGKSPCIVDKEADLDIAARRIVWGKLLNAGQTCIAPDYLLADATIKEALIERLVYYIRQYYGDDPQKSDEYPRLVNRAAFERVASLIGQQGSVIYGGNVDPADRYIAPTLIDHVTPSDPIMQQEIFGPVLPIISFDKLDQALHIIAAGEKPLALYYFGKQEKGRNVIAQTTSGGACINDTIMHIANHRLPFGGVGHSGMGKYHGQFSFETFSNLRAVVRTSTWIDFRIKYPPYPTLKLLKKLIR